MRKFFPLDKNYLLESAQLSTQDDLLTSLLEKVKSEYEKMHNPLGIEDTFSEKIKTCKPATFKPLYGFYQNLAGIYRYKFGENQLQFLWDGDDHFSKYQRDWQAAFEEWTDLFCKHALFIQAVLDLTVFLPENRHAQLAENRMNHFILKTFELRIHKNKGIVEMRVA